MLKDRNEIKIKKLINELDSDYKMLIIKKTKLLKEKDKIKKIYTSIDEKKMLCSLNDEIHLIDIKLLDLGMDKYIKNSKIICELRIRKVISKYLSDTILNVNDSIIINKYINCKESNETKKLSDLEQVCLACFGSGNFTSDELEIISQINLKFKEKGKHI